jgi:signal transduction histidine kinase/AraC-like DNA-binding protein
MSFFTFAQSTIDSLTAIALTGKKDTLTIRALIELSEILAGRDNQEAIENASKALDLSTKLGYKYGKSEAYYYLGLAHFYIGKYPLALDFYKKAFEIKQQLNDTKTQANLLALMALIHENVSNSAEAQNNLFKALTIYEQIGDERGIGTCYDNIAISFFNQKDYNKSKEYFLKSHEIAVKQNSPYYLAVSYNNLYKIFDQLGERDKAKNYLLKAIEINEEIQNKQSLSAAYNNLGKLFFSANELNDAELNYGKSIELKIALNNRLGLATSYNNLGELYLKKEVISQSIQWYDKAKNLANDVGSVNELRLATQGLYDCYKKTGNYHLATQLADELFILRDSIFNEEKAKQLSTLEARYQNVKKQQEIEMLSKENDLQKKEVRQKNTIIFLIFIALLLVLATAVLVIVMYQNKQETNKILSAQNEEIKHQKEEIQTQNELLVNQAKILAELDEMKSRFFANISHELRTPLTLILSPLSQILDSNKYDRATFEVMQRNAQKLKTMIDELLQLARMEKGAVDLHFVEANINELVSGVVNSFEGVATEKKITIETKGLDSECKFYFDADGIEKVISNLLSNAVKFTPHGKRIKITSNHNTEYFTLCFSDEGIGIPEGETEKIFNRFFRASNSKMVTGTGIGLSLVSDIVTLHGGTVEAGQSAMGGAEFLVKIPLKQNLEVEQNIDDFDADDNSEEPTENTVTQVNSTKKTLLLVEDNYDLRNFISSSLNETYNVLEAENGKIGLQVASNEHIDIIISDVMMPEMDGYTLTKTIRSNSELCHIPIVLLTAKSSEQSVIKGLESEADAYLTKPFSLTHLKAVLVSQLKIRQKLHKKFQREISVNPSEVTTTSIDEQFITNATRIVEENIGNEAYNVDDFCSALAMSRTSVHRKITAITGLSTTDFIRTIRLKRAAQLIKGRVASISEISFMVGFADVSYFSKCFKKEFGVTPTEFQS